MILQVCVNICDILSIFKETKDIPAISRNITINHMQCHESLSEAPEWIQYSITGFFVLSVLLAVGLLTKDWLQDRARARRIAQMPISSD